MKTEDDTFNALRRIPQDQAREKLNEFGYWFEAERERHYSAIAYNKRMKFWNPIRRFFGMATNHRPTEDPQFEREINERLKGTGWTFESYAVEIDKPILEQKATIHAITMKRRIYLLCAVLSMFALGIMMGVALGLIWPEGLVLGINLSNIIPLTYFIVAEKFWPYPSYHYRYE